MCLSVAGISRQYLGKTGTVSVRNDVLSGTGSLRNRLEDVALHEVWHPQTECIYGWIVAFRQVWTRITVRIMLNPDDDVTDAELATLRNRWANGIDGIWSNAWRSSRSGETSCPFTFEVEWTSENPHHTVRVRRGPARSNTSTWDTEDTGGVAAHEYGHYIGHPDEYQDPLCPWRSPVNTGTVMDNNSANVPRRLVQPFANRIGVSLV
jgi:hypothetical protein